MIDSSTMDDDDGGCREVWLVCGGGDGAGGSGSEVGGSGGKGTWA